MMRTAFIAAGVCLSMIGSCFAQTSAAAISRVETRIPAQALASALKQFSTLEHVRLLFFTSDVKNLRTSGAYGNFTVDEALARLLSGTGVKYQHLDANSISIIQVSRSQRAVRDASPTSITSHHSPTPGHKTPPESTREDHPDTQLASHFPNSRNSTRLLGEVIVTAQLYRQPAFAVPIDLDVV